VTVTLVWEALRDIPRDYTMFVHLRDTPSSAYAQADGPPAQNRLPTRWWQAGERYIDQRTFRLPDYTSPVVDLYIGVLTPEGQRLPAIDATGQPILNNEVVVEHDLHFVFSIPPGLLYLPLVAQPGPQPLPSTPYP
jgi:hypothetical protein